MTRKEYCCQVDQHCKAPPTDRHETPGPYARATCYRCGGAVCVNCSLVTVYYGYGRQRLCHNCHIEYMGDDVAVGRHIYALAGYQSEAYPKMVPK